MAKLWQGSGGGLHPLVEAYTVPGRDGPRSVTSNMVGMGRFL